MSITTNIKLNESIIPCIPFIWYREQELTCPIDYINNVTFSKIKELYDIKYSDISEIQDNENVYVVIQRNISETDNLYVCLHTILYYELHKNNVDNIKDNLLIIPNKFRINIPFEVNTVMLDNTELIELPNSLKINQTVSGSVHIHNSAFSPPGCLHFKTNLNNTHTILLCKIKCVKYDINLNALFILFNDMKDYKIEETIKELIEKLKQ